MDFKMYGKKNLEKSHLGNNCLNIAGCIEITLSLVFIFMGNNDHSFRKKGKVRTKVCAVLHAKQGKRKRQADAQVHKIVTHIQKHPHLKQMSRGTSNPQLIPSRGKPHA